MKYKLNEDRKEVIDHFLNYDVPVRCNNCDEKVWAHVTPEEALCPLCGSDVGMTAKERERAIMKLTLTDEDKEALMECAYDPVTPGLTEKMKENLRKEGKGYLKRYLIKRGLLSFLFAVLMTIVVFMTVYSFGLPDKTSRAIASGLCLVGFWCIQDHWMFVVRKRAEEMRSFISKEC